MFSIKIVFLASCFLVKYGTSSSAGFQLSDLIDVRIARYSNATLHLFPRSSWGEWQSLSFWPTVIIIQIARFVNNSFNHYIQ